MKYCPENNKVVFQFSENGDNYSFFSMPIFKTLYHCINFGISFNSEFSLKRIKRKKHKKLEMNICFLCPEKNL
jgi:hypothetical protein